MLNWIATFVTLSTPISEIDTFLMPHVMFACQYQMDLDLQCSSQMSLQICALALVFMFKDSAESSRILNAAVGAILVSPVNPCKAKS